MSAMTVRECYRQVALFRKAERIPNIEPSVFPRIVARWRKEGLPENTSLAAFFGLDRTDEFRGVSYDPLPGVPGRYASLEQYEPLLGPLGYRLERDAAGHMVAVKEGREYYIAHDTWGGIRLYPKPQSGSTGDADDAEGAFVHAVDAVPDRSAWERIKNDFQPDLAARIFPGQPPDRWQQWLEEHRNAPDIVRILEAPSMVGGMILTMGFENYCIKVMTEPELISEILTTRAELFLSMMDRLYDAIEWDMLWFWEDMAFRNGPMIGPEPFGQLIVPLYRRLSDAWRARGGEIVALDSDGDIRPLIPGLIAGGINHLWPLEPFAGMDVVALRREYGQAFSMRGGIDKFCVAKGKDAIRRELDRIAPVVQDGGYIPHLDHQIPDCPFENYAYYMEQKKLLLGGS